MAAQGYLTHAAENRRLTGWLIAGYVLAFQLIGAFALTIFLLIFDPANTILSNPLGYAVRYALPLAALTGLQFWYLYRGHADAVRRSLDIRAVTRLDEPRFVRIAEEQCIALGIRQPRFGVIEVEAPNAVTVGEGPTRGMIAVTRGLIDRLDDEELAAVLAHEASHIRNGDTRLLAANHALMRTTVILQTHNPLRLEDWRQLLLVLLLPPMLLIMLASGTVTMASMRLARAARRGLKVSRDHIADGEAVRVTHFPEALAGAICKVSGQGAFPGSERYEAALFDGVADHEGGTHPTAQDRIEAINALGRGLMQPGRFRRDTRESKPAGGGGFGSKLVLKPALAAPALARNTDDLPPLDKPSLESLALFFTDREKFWRWQNACIDAQEWRADQPRNIFGVAPHLTIPLAMVVTFLLVLHWPTNGDFTRMSRMFSPTAMVDIALDVSRDGGRFSETSCPEGKCPGR